MNIRKFLFLIIQVILAFICLETDYSLWATVPLIIMCLFSIVLLAVGNIILGAMSGTTENHPYTINDAITLVASLIGHGFIFYVLTLWNTFGIILSIVWAFLYLSYIIKISMK